MSWERNFPFDKCNNFLLLGGGGVNTKTQHWALNMTQKLLEKLWKDSLLMLFTQARPSKDYKMAQNVSYKTNEKVHFNKEI